MQTMCVGSDQGLGGSDVKGSKFGHYKEHTPSPQPQQPRCKHRDAATRHGMRELCQIQMPFRMHHPGKGAQEPLASSGGAPQPTGGDLFPL